MSANPPSGYWVIAEGDLLEVLRRAHAGEDPGLLVAEMYANGDERSTDEPWEAGP